MGKVTALRKNDAPRPENTGPARPFPPAQMTAAADKPLLFAPAREVKAWVEHHLLREVSPLHNPDHLHLTDGDVEFLWAIASFPKQGRTVLGTAEQVMFRAGGWQKLRQEAQMIEWFGRVPKFLVTLAADFCLECDDTDFCALVEHELYHIAHKLDDYGAPKFDKESGLPILCMRGHDVEEFVGVVRRYGVPQAGALRKLLQAAEAGPEVGYARIAAACGTCMERAA